MGVNSLSLTPNRVTIGVHVMFQLNTVAAIS